MVNADKVMNVSSQQQQELRRITSSNGIAYKKHSNRNGLGQTPQDETDHGYTTSSPMTSSTTNTDHQDHEKGEDKMRKLERSPPSRSRAPTLLKRPSRQSKKLSQRQNLWNKIQGKHESDDDAYHESASNISSSSFTKGNDPGTMKATGVGRRIRRLIAKESRAVFWWRLLVYAMLIVTAIFVTIFVYTFIKTDELDEFEEHYRDNAHRVVESFIDTVERKLGAINAMATTITSYAIDTNKTFPFVTVPHFVERGSDLRVLADALSVHYMPLVTDETRKDWEDYAYVNRYHIDKAYIRDHRYRDKQDGEYDYHDHDRILQQIAEQQEEEEEQIQDQSSTTFTARERSTFPATEMEDGTGYIPRIWSIDASGKVLQPEGSGPYLPLWQRSPVGEEKQTMLNWNFANTAVFRGILPILQDDSKAVIGRATVPTTQGQQNLVNNMRISQYRHDIDIYASEPLSFMAFPVFDHFEDDFYYDTGATTGNNTVYDDDGQSQQRQLVGVLATNLYWRQYFIDILSPKSVGFICVLENSYGQQFSYRVDGSEVTFLGVGDPHDPEFEKWEIKADINSNLEERAKPQTRAYTTVKLHQTAGQYTLRVYPSQATLNVFLTNMPRVYTVVVASIFMTTMIVFLLFTNFVERRQAVVMKRAIQSGTIVSSLFPEQVEDRLYDETAPPPCEEEDPDTEGNIIPMSKIDRRRRSISGLRDSVVIEHDDKRNAPYHRMMSTLGGFGEMMGSTEHSGTQQQQPRPIADLFHDTTIMFADLAGFTSWSSDRRPDQVFELLETLYAAFDVTAEKRGVFKVETIGDCYLAVTGVPNPQNDHAVIMAKFARDCVVKMNDLVCNKLSEQLGHDTAKLQLRVGLHSGSVTAGVLRGQKSRFQLFGDTVNTASRIESTSKPGKIQVSQTTADELVMKGKQHWLIPRKERVVAKGKGELITYWVKIPILQQQQKEHNQQEHNQQEHNQQEQRQQQQQQQQSDSSSANDEGDDGSMGGRLPPVSMKFRPGANS